MNVTQIVCCPLSQQSWNTVFFIPARCANIVFYISFAFLNQFKTSFILNCCQDIKKDQWFTINSTSSPLIFITPLVFISLWIDSVLSFYYVRFDLQILLIFLCVTFVLYCHYPQMGFAVSGSCGRVSYNRWWWWRWQLCPGSASSSDPAGAAAAAALQPMPTWASAVPGLCAGASRSCAVCWLQWGSAAVQAAVWWVACVGLMAGRWVRLPCGWWCGESTLQCTQWYG